MQTIAFQTLLVRGSYKFTCVSIIIGKTGFVGSHLLKHHQFDLQVNRSNLYSLKEAETDLLICAGLPAAKWQANREPEEDWENVRLLAEFVATTSADQAVLISTVDVYQPAIEVNEEISPSFNGPAAYGTNRAWFEAFFRWKFKSGLIIRLPGLYASDVRKNLIHDLLHQRRDQLDSVNPNSAFQFFNVTRTWEVINQALAKGITLLNVTSQPVAAQEVAEIFGAKLSGEGAPQRYDMRSVHADSFGGENGYLFSRNDVLGDIEHLASGVHR